MCSCIFSPIQAVSLSINPLYIMIPAAVAASYAFMLPVATPPNAIAFSYGYLKVYDMVSNCVCIIHVYYLTIVIGTDRYSNEHNVYSGCQSLHQYTCCADI